MSSRWYVLYFPNPCARYTARQQLRLTLFFNNQVQHGLAKRARKHELTLPRSWGHHRYGPDGEGEIVGSLVGGKLDADKNEHASERFSWRKAYEHLRKSGLAERERVLRLMWERLVVAESAPEKLALADERVPGVNL